MHTYFGSFEDDAVWSGTLDFLRIDPTVSGDATFAIDYIRFYDSAAIPEPGTTALFIGFGMLVLVALRRRR